MKRVTGTAMLLLAGLLMTGCDGSGTEGTNGTGGTGPSRPAATLTTVSAEPPVSPSPAPPGTTGPAGPRSPAPPRGETLVVVTRSGGIAGRRDSVIVNTDGTYTTLSGGRKTGPRRMKAAGLTELRRAIAASGIGKLPRVLFHQQVPDAFVYAVSHGGHEVVTSEAEPVPAIQRIIVAVPLPS
jgi:hypothetical protein